MTQTLTPKQVAANQQRRKKESLELRTAVDAMERPGLSPREKHNASNVVQNVVLRGTGFKARDGSDDTLARLAVALVKGRASVALSGIDEAIERIATAQNLELLDEGKPGLNRTIIRRLDRLL